ncbi:MAG: hypothetical protein QY321_00100 [Patescibacteria group bacterium]|nr:MAG: hypothetical protein QY321_04355 [Patescibacteria group bacterium]WKZ24827.1 MAG: hypothetical protein QY321_00100 [Patescibacteria group bacterium]
MKIHFICSFNATRSRLAEAYARSVFPKGFLIDSSGVKATGKGFNKGLSRYAYNIIKKNNLEKYVSKKSVGTTLELLQDRDLIIFMEPRHLSYVQTNFNYTPLNYECWGIKDESNDFMRHLFGLGFKKEDQMDILIMNKVDDLLKRLVV